MQPYYCPAGLKTIGWGHAIKEYEQQQMSDGISQEHADYLLEQDIEQAKYAIYRHCRVPLNYSQEGALISFVFNCGAGAFQASSLRQKLLRGEYLHNGFVARDLRRTFGNFKGSAIPAPGEIDFDLYDREEKELIYKVYAVYGEHTASYLRQLIYEHSIWRDAMTTDNKIISKQKMSEFFKRLINTDFLLMSKEDELTIETAEDQWWMSYDSGVSAEDVTNFLS